MVLFDATYILTQTVEIAINVIKATGLFPMNRYVFQDSDFIAAEKEAGTHAPQQTVLLISLLQRTPVTRKATDGTPNKIVSPYEIAPVSQIKRKTTIQGQKTAGACLVIT